MSKITDLIVPNIGDFKNVEIIEILTKPEQNINKNDGLITLESDKSSVEVPSQFSGKIKNIKVKKIYIHKNRIGDHIWYISSNKKFKKDYPNWKQKYNTNKILKQLISKY